MDSLKQVQYRVCWIDNCAYFSRKLSDHELNFCCWLVDYTDMILSTGMAYLARTIYLHPWRCINTAHGVGWMEISSIGYMFMKYTASALASSSITDRPLVVIVCAYEQSTILRCSHPWPWTLYLVTKYGHLCQSTYDCLRVLNNLDSNKHPREWYIDMYGQLPLPHFPRYAVISMSKYRVAAKTMASSSASLTGQFQQGYYTL